MKNFVYQLPTKFLFGRGAENEVGREVRALGGTKVLIHYGGGSAVRSGLIDRVKKALDAENIGYVELGGVQPNPRDTMVYKGIALARREGVDFVLAVGGGSSIDSSKAIAHGLQSTATSGISSAARPSRKRPRRWAWCSPCPPRAANPPTAASSRRRAPEPSAVCAAS